MKVLIISHNPITTYQSMGKTFLSLFSEFLHEELCQLYVYPTLPDIDICNSYYKITDRNIFKSYFRFGKVNSREITSEQIDTTKHDFCENKKEENFLNTKKTPLKTLCRDAMWKFSRWNNRFLNQWLMREKPTCIFLAPGEAKFIYDVALTISKAYSLPIITYICDEFYFIDGVKECLDRPRLTLLKKKIRQLMNKTSCIVSISDEIMNLYSEEFNVPSVTIMTGASIPVAENPNVGNSLRGITYLGNIAYDRTSSILDIGRALDEINLRNGSNVKLFLYTRSMSETIQNELKKVKSIEYCGYVTGAEFNRILQSADALLHIESFGETFTEKVKNSISTKIADSLASGNPLVAYAPKGIASMNYLISTKAALTITDKDQLIEKLEKFVLESELRVKIARSGLIAAKKNHIAKSNSVKLHEICKEHSV